MICVASAHVRCKKSRLWRNLQWQFLKETTTSKFEYHIIANALNPDPFKEHATSVLHIPKSSHFTCIREILALFETSDSQYFLLLDSDCWPIRKGWDQYLIDKLSSFRFAAPVRIENLDVYPHPSAVFFHRDHLLSIDFGYTHKKNLLGNPSSDVGSAMGIDGCFPLLKTNYISPHPVFASIYGDCFYHHCAGSRSAGVRCSEYYQHMITPHQQKKIYSFITKALIKSPMGFINELRGRKRPSLLNCARNAM